MRPKEHREGGEQELFRARLDQIINLDHALFSKYRRDARHLLARRSQYAQNTWRATWR